MKMNKKKRFILFMALILIFTSCVENAGVRNSDRSGKSTDTQGKAGGHGKNSAKDDESDLSGGASDTTGKIELRHLVDPFDGTYKTKVTIPKNFTGLLYLSGINVTSLSDRLIHARFNFGRDLEPITIPATIGRGSGITPQTDIEVVILDMNNKPFENIRLQYDLFDYNLYDDDEDGVEESDPTSDPRDSNLYCRGLRLEYDPTFEGTSCDSAGSRCLYGYAKIKDSGLYDISNERYLNVSSPQLDERTGGYSTSSSELPLANALTKCLPDNQNGNNLNFVLGGIYNLTNTSAAITYDSLLDSSAIKSSVDFSNYKYRGPFRALAQSEWQVSGAALFSDLAVGGTEPTGLFQKILTNSTQFDPNAGYRSFMFPRAGSMALRSGVEYFGNQNNFGTIGIPLGVRSITALLSNGDTEFMDGCNIRISNYDNYTNESISSCNVTATIELLTKNTDGTETIINSSSDVKLQLIRPSLTDYQGQEVLYTSMKKCTSSQSCGGNECCYNHRCWSKDLVTQCIEDSEVVGNKGVGETCNTDYECSSLCCNRAKGTCQVHINNETDQVLCSKGPGEKCIAKEWCRKESVKTCKIYKTGVTNTGDIICSRRCYPVMTFGDCKNGSCVSPPIPEVPDFDPNNCPANLPDLP